jgi:hypothetical protein
MIQFHSTRAYFDDDLGIIQQYVNEMEGLTQKFMWFVTDISLDIVRQTRVWECDRVVFIQKKRAGEAIIYFSIRDQARNAGAYCARTAGVPEHKYPHRFVQNWNKTLRGRKHHQIVTICQILWNSLSGRDRDL